MQNLQGKIKKLLFAVNIKNDGNLIYLFSRKQIFSAAKNRTSKLRIPLIGGIVLQLIDSLVFDYTAKVGLQVIGSVGRNIFPNHKKDPHRYKKEVVQADVYSGFKDIEILLLLADILKNGNQKAFSLVEENMM